VVLLGPTDTLVLQNITKRGVGFRDTQAALGVSGDSKDVKDPKRPR